MIKISEITPDKNQQSVEFNAMLMSKTLLKKKNGDNYLQVELMDATGTMVCPIWSHPEDKFDDLKEHGFYFCYGTASLYNNQMQVNNVILTEISVTDIDISDFIKVYKISDENMSYFKKTIKDLPKEYKDIIKYCIDKVGKENFYIAPGASSHHHNGLGGLLYHTIGMLKTADALHAVYDTDEINWDRLKTKIVLHDIMKTKEYNYPIISYNKDCLFSHVEMGAALIMTSDLKGADEIALGVMTHHGQYGPYEPKNIEDLLLHLIDMIDSRLVDQKEDETDSIKHADIISDALVKIATQLWRDENE